MCIRDRAMNMYSHGVDPKLDFSDMPDICATYERVTRMHIYERTPYACLLYTSSRVVDVCLCGKCAHAQHGGSTQHCSGCLLYTSRCV